jgi:hypothetical protein
MLTSDVCLMLARLLDTTFICLLKNIQFEYLNLLVKFTTFLLFQVAELQMVYRPS